MKKQTPRPAGQQASKAKPSVKSSRQAVSEPFYKRHRNILEWLVITLLCLVTYANSIGNDYNLDDGYVVSIDAANQQTAKGIAGIKEIMTSKYSSGFGVTYSYRPLGKVTMAIEYDMWGNNPHYSHLVNILLFAVNAFLLLLLFRQIAAQLQFREEKVLYLAILLFIVHPIHTEVVCSIKNREEILCFGFMLSAILVYLRYLDAAGWKRRAAWLSAFTALVVLSLLSKQSGFNIFGVILLINLYRYNGAPVIPASWLQRLRDPDTWKYLVPVGIVFYALVLVLKQIPDSLPSDDLVRLFETDPYGFAPASHIFPNGVQTLLFYCRKLLAPFPLLFYYGYDMLPDRGWNSFYPYLGLLVFGGIAWFLYRSFKKGEHRYAAFWVLFFGITIIPFANIGLFPNVTGSIVGERLVYQASAGFCLLLAMGIQAGSGWLYRRVPAFRDMPAARPFFLVAAAFVLPYLLLTVDRNRYWESKTTLYEHDIRWLDRSLRANYMIGSSYMNTLTTGNLTLPERQDLLEKARHYFQQSLEVYPRSGDGLLSLGKMYGAYYKDMDSARYYLLLVDTIVPKTYVSAREMLGDISFMENDSLRALGYYREAFDRFRENFSAYEKSMQVLFGTRRYQEAADLAAIAASNKWPEAFLDLGDACLNLGDTARAVANYELALRYGWKSESLVNNLRTYYQTKGMTDKIKLLPR